MCFETGQKNAKRHTNLAFRLIINDCYSNNVASTPTASDYVGVVLKCFIKAEYVVRKSLTKLKRLYIFFYIYIYGMAFILMFCPIFLEFIHSSNFKYGLENSGLTFEK